MSIPCPHCGRPVNPAALLAVMGKGGRKNYSAAERKRRAVRMAAARKARWAKSPNDPSSVTAAPDALLATTAERGCSLERMVRPLPTSSVSEPQSSREERINHLVASGQLNGLPLSDVELQELKTAQAEIAYLKELSAFLSEYRVVLERHLGRFQVSNS